MGKTNEISPELVQLKKDLLEWCYENCKEVDEYYDDIINSLSSYSTIISYQSEFYIHDYMYYFDEDENLLWIYYGDEGFRDLSKSAKAITIYFNDNRAKYNEYTISTDEDFENEPCTDEWFEEVEEWNNTYHINEKMSIISAIKKFNDININLENLDNNTTNTIITDFIYNIDDSNKLEVQFEDNTIEDFLSNDTSELTIIAIDTKTPLIKIRKEKDNFIFIVDITNEDGDNFFIRSKFTDGTQLQKLINDTIDALQSYKQFSKYADELENCI